MTQSALTATLVVRMPIVLLFMARSPLEVLKSLVRRRTARISPHATFNYCGGVTTSWPVTYTSEREGKKERTDERFIASAARPDTRRRAVISLHSDECRASRRRIGL
jgi:hypothetical protein